MWTQVASRNCFSLNGRIPSKEQLDEQVIDSAFKKIAENKINNFELHFVYDGSYYFGFDFRGFRLFFHVGFDFEFGFD